MAHPRPARRRFPRRTGRRRGWTACRRFRKRGPDGDGWMGWWISGVVESDQRAGESAGDSALEPMPDVGRDVGDRASRPAGQGMGPGLRRSPRGPHDLLRHPLRPGEIGPGRAPSARGLLSAGVQRQQADARARPAGRPRSPRSRRGLDVAVGVTRRLRRADASARPEPVACSVVLGPRLGSIETLLAATSDALWRGWRGRR